MYLTTVIDLYDRKIIGWSLNDAKSNEATSLAAWRMAVKNREIADGLIFHSDRGVQYAIRKFANTVGFYGVIRSMGRKRNCWDNAVYEESLRKNPEYESYINDKGVDINQYYIMNDLHFSQKYNRKYVVEFIQKETSPNRFVDFFVFDNRGNLIKYEKSFDEVETGVWKSYSSDGKLTTEENKDVHYKFSIHQVIDFSKKHKGNLSTSGSVKRTFDQVSKKYVYEIEWVIDEPKKSFTKAFILDGVTGSIIKEYEKSVPRIVL